MNKKEAYEIKHSSSDGFCEVCGKQVNIYGTRQIAHCIAQTETNIKKYGTFFIQHPLNYKLVCSLACNHVCNIGFNKGAVLDKLAEIVLYEMKKHTGGSNDD